jgi:tight adherence protein C
MIDPNSSAAIWWLVAVMLPAAGLAGWRLWVIDQRDRVQRLRLEAFRGRARVEIPSGWSQFSHRVAPFVGQVEQQQLLKRLAAAGFKHHGSLATFIGIKVISATVLVALTWTVLEWRHLLVMLLMRLGALGIAAIIGWRMPELVLDHLVRRRRARIEQGIPDALDLLVVCAESGLSLNQSIEEISRQLRFSNRDVGDEFAVTSAEMRVLTDFALALDNLVERTGLENLRGLVATLKQSLNFGTSLAESLRLIASEMRAARHARMEERAARLPVLMAIPMMMFILPCLLMIIGTPVVLRMIDAFKNLHIGGFSGIH